MNIRAFGLKMKFGTVISDIVTFVALALCTGIAASVVLGGIVLLLTGEPRGTDSQSSITAAALQKNTPPTPAAVGDPSQGGRGTTLREAP